MDTPHQLPSQVRLMEPCPEPSSNNIVREVKLGAWIFRVVKCEAHGGFYNSVGARRGGYSTGGIHYTTLAGALSGLRSLVKSYSGTRLFYTQRHRQGSVRTVAINTHDFIEFLADVIRNGWQFADLMNVNRYYLKELDDDYRVISERRLDFIEMGELWDIAERRVKKSGNG